MARRGRRGRRSRSKQNRSGKSTSTSSSSSSSSSSSGGSSGSSGSSGGGSKGKKTSSKKKKLTGRAKLQSLGRAPTSPRDSKAAQRFRAREAQGLSGLTGRPKVGSTAAMVARDNRMYGNTVPSGSFGISAQGKAEAESNRRYNRAFSNLQASDPGMAKYISSLPANVRKDALIGGQTRAAGVELGIGLGTLAAAKLALGSTLTGAVTKGLGFKGVQAGFTGMGKKGFDAIRGGAKYIASNKPQILGKGAYSAPTLKGAQRYAGATGSLGGAQTPGGVIKSIVPGKASRIGFIESQAKVPGATFDKGVQLANKLSAGNYGTSALANRLRSQMVSGVAPGGGFGSNLGNIAGKTGVTTAVAGGLNIASSGGVDSGDPTARVSGFKSVRPLGIAREAIQGFGDMLTGQRTDFDQLGRLGFGATTDKLKDAAKNMKINEVTDTLKKSPIRQAYVGFDYGIDVPDAIKQVDETRSVLNKTFKDFEGKNIDLGNIKPGSLDKNVKAEDLRGGISNVMYNLDRMPTLARGLSAFQKDTEGGGDREFRKDLRFTFNREVDAPTGVPGRDLMKSTTPGIVNRVLSGKLKDMGQEAITQNNLTGGMTADKFDTIASTLNKNLKTEGTIAKTRLDELTALAKRFGPGGGQAPTPKSILEGVNPFRRSGSNSGNRVSQGGGNTPVGRLPQVPNPAEVELPIIPQQQQQGTQASNLASIQNQSYQNTFNNLMAQFRPRSTNNRRRTFRTTFNRDYFSQFV